MSINAVAALQAVHQQVPQVTFAAEVAWWFKLGIMQLSQLNLHIASLSDGHGVFHRLRCLGKKRSHFVRAAQVKLLGHVAHPIRRVEV